MSLPQPPPNPPHLSPAVQLKLYQSFIFSIPILFSIILLLLFYLFYLKRRASALSFPPPLVLPTSSNPTSPYFSSPCSVDLKGYIKDKLPVILFDEELRTRESQCCVCLGEFEIKEELVQIPLCQHVFHVECIHLWLHSSSTCPLCRCLVIPTKLHNHAQQGISEPPQQDSTTSNQHDPQTQSSEQQQQQQQSDDVNSNITNISREQTMITIEGSSSVSICLTGSSRLPDDLTICRENEMAHDQESVVLHIRTP
ncbi:hypothetical protein F2P56_020389 [Juglans regia]|uniref:RING-type E3 ubiquitin transferase n=2 Tax=Juglans regia TaxID=51240 RepID=A0A2I4EY12_JUGRE|nr:probable E3 ubiquitin-protein ligase RHA4A [Juglans regia]KAF5460525.1 hypothetical protein F2P56_020389 [Juglans regia]